MSREFGYHVAAFHHAVEAYKIADLLAEHGVCAAMWADWWASDGVYDGIPENIAFVDAAPNGCARLFNSDSKKVFSDSTRKPRKPSLRAAAGLEIPPERAIKWLTANPAKTMGVLGGLER